ncbi:uncharacterized protein METZ01_LOCUS168182, partial [marine metagenome]
MLREDEQGQIILNQSIRSSTSGHHVAEYPLRI